MAAQPFDHIDRQMRRSEEIADQALAAPAGEMMGLKVLAPEMKVARQAWDGVQATVSSLKRVAAKEGEESKTAAAALRKIYAELQPMLAHKAGFLGLAPSEYGTEDDFFTVVEEMEQVFRENAGQEWADGPLAKLAEVADAAAKEFAEAVQGGRALQKSQGRRNEVADESREILVPFRRCVRGTFGSTSKEYRDLLDKQYRKRQGDEPQPAPTPTPDT